MKPVKWGLIGTGKIAGRFASDLKLSNQAILIGATGRDPDKAEAFARAHETKSFSSIDELLKSDVDVVYVATPHPLHMQNSLAAIRAGKAVLCEKPFTMNFQEAKRVVEEARTENVFLMEAMWTRFFPIIREVLQFIESGAIGQVKSLASSFGYRSVFDASSRVFNKELGGGALLDVGVYSVSLAHMIFKGSPTQVSAKAEIGQTGVDESSAWTLQFAEGGVAQGKASVVHSLANEAIIYGSNGSTIRIPDFWHPKEYYLNETRKEFAYAGLGFQFEANEVMDCLRAGKKESVLLPLEFSLSVMQSMDLIQNQFRI